MIPTRITVNGASIDPAPLSIPASRDFRAAWHLSGTVIDVDMAVARDIHRDRIRAARRPAFAHNDIAINDALLADDVAAKAQALARRDELRDATDDPAIEAAASPDALSAVWPAGLTPVGQGGQSHGNG